VAAERIRLDRGNARERRGVRLIFRVRRVHPAHATPRRPEKEANMFGILGWILFGLIVGVIAKLIMPGKDPGGFIVTILLGIAGAVVAGFIGRALGWYGPDEAAGFLMSILGAILILFIYRRLRRPTTTAR
jgi:uncharacterized membrane protein YeaQ/YmgE (transglycosylase-associated protein family)